MHPTRRTFLSALPLLAAPSLLRAATPENDARDRQVLLDAARQLDQMRSLIIARNGDILIAESLRGPDIDRPVNVKSVSKTIVASLVGIAIDKGVLESPAQTLEKTAPDLIPSDADPRVADLTLADLLTMQAGLERTSGRNYGGWVQSPDWVANALSRPFVATPGQRMLYSTGSYHVLGAALAVAAGQSLHQLAQSWLGSPLGIDIPPWTRDPQGRFMGGNNMHLAPLAMLRFAETWRLGGRFDDQSIVSSSWIDASWRPHTHSPFSGDDYGYGWFLTRLAGHRAVYARGYGGQMIYILPDQRLSIAITSDPNRPARSHGYIARLEQLIIDHLLQEPADI